MSFHPARIALYTALAAFSVLLIGLTSARIQYTKTRRSIDPIKSSPQHYYDPIIVELLATSILAFLWAVPLMFLLHARKTTGLVSSYLFELLGLFVIWVMYLVGAAIASHYWHGLGFCWGFNQCRIITSIIAFSWVNFAITTFLMGSTIASLYHSHSGIRDPLYGGVGSTGTGYGGPETRNANAGNAGPVSTGGV